ncbi:DUF2157 domain-containing protein [Pontibacter toksunensis]|uniref:DUF2157 domain-containing protein n=1 Tax=Pontibacter toksunensis TaxID=1332631 RepID=A0ABW6BWK4_9BACT
MKPNITRDLLYSVARHSNWREGSMEAKLRSTNIYASTRDWASFVRLLLLGTGAGFVVAGIVFFFAYNWADMHKFVKLGLLEVLILLLACAILFSKLSTGIKNMLLTGSALLVGVLFAVFGQIYQTGANAYDFFMGWTACIALWVVVSRFPPLWLIFLALANTTLMLYAQQVAVHWPFAVLLDLLFIVNASAVVVWEALTLKGKISALSRWFPRVVCLAAVTAITISMIANIFDSFQQDWGLCFLLVVAGYTAGMWHGRRTHDLFYLSVIPFSGIVVAASFIARLVEFAPELMVLLACLFVIGSTTLLVRHIIHTNHKWHGQ